MHTLDNFDKEKPLIFCGVKFKSDVEAAISEDVVLTPLETLFLLSYLVTCCWREDFDKSITKSSESKTLTGWISANEFYDFIHRAGGANKSAKMVMNKLKTVTLNWKMAGVQEVMFRGHLA